MQFKCQNPDHPFSTSALCPPELTHEDKVLAKEILGKYPQFRSWDVDDFDLYVLGEVTDRSRSTDIKKEDRDAIESKVLGMYYKFYRRTLRAEFPEKLASMISVNTSTNTTFHWQRKSTFSFYDGCQSLIEDKLRLLA